jgi:hypothetical protein
LFEGSALLLCATSAFDYDSPTPRCESQGLTFRDTSMTVCSTTGMPAHCGCRRCRDWPSSTPGCRSCSLCEDRRRRRESAVGVCARRSQRRFQRRRSPSRRPRRTRGALDLAAVPHPAVLRSRKYSVVRRCTPAVRSTHFACFDATRFVRHVFVMWLSRSVYARGYFVSGKNASEHAPQTAVAVTSNR